MPTRHRRTAPLAAIALLALVACEDAAAPAAADTDPAADVAAMTAEVVVADLALFGGAQDAASVEDAQLRAGCEYVDATARWECAPVTRDGRTLVRSYAFFDTAGLAQRDYSTTATERVNRAWLDSGVVNRARDGVTHVDSTVRRRTADVTGLAGSPDTVHVWNAVGTATHRVTRSGQITRRLVMTAHDTTTGVRVRLPRDVNPWPLSGTIVRNVLVDITREGERTTSRTEQRRVVVTFNGTALVPLTVNGVAHTLNLETRRVTRD